MLNIFKPIKRHDTPFPSPNFAMGSDERWVGKERKSFFRKAEKSTRIIKKLLFIKTVP